MKRIVITGATGFVGGAIMRNLGKKYSVIGLGRNNQLAKMITSHGQFLEVDITKSIPQIKADVVIHSAALAGDTYDFEQLYKANLEGTKNIFEQIHAPHFIYISSSSVYNFNKSAHLEGEKIEYEALDDYGKTKRLAELYLLQQKKHRIHIVRPRNIYGIGDRLLMPRLIGMASKGSITLPGDLNTKTSLTHIDRLVSLVDELIKKQPKKTIFNVTDEEIYAMKAVFITILESYYGRSIQIKRFPLRLATNLTALLEYLNFKPPLTQMALANLSKDKVLAIDAIKENGLELPNRSFYNSLDSIIDWLHSLDHDMIAKQSPLLSWLNTTQNLQNPDQDSEHI